MPAGGQEKGSHLRARFRGAPQRGRQGFHEPLLDVPGPSQGQAHRNRLSEWRRGGTWKKAWHRVPGERSARKYN